MHPGLASGWIIAAAIVGLVLGAPLAELAGRVRRPPHRFPRYAYLAASAVCAAAFALVAASFAAPLELAAYLVFAAAAVLLSLVDLADHRLPDVIVLPSLAAVAGLLVASSFVQGEWSRAASVVGGAVGLFAVYLLLALISPRGMGMGDVKLAAVIGAATGYLGLSVWLGALLGGFLVGAIISLVSLALRRVQLKSLVPFGPSMLLGAFLALLLF